MANVKDFVVVGKLPFDFGDMDCPIESQQLARMLGVTLRPTINVKLEWNQTPDMVPNKHGGWTAIYGFCLRGREALRWEWFAELERLVKAVGGSVDSKKIVDVEA